MANSTDDFLVYNGETFDTFTVQQFQNILAAIQATLRDKGANGYSDTIVFSIGEGCEVARALADYLRQFDIECRADENSNLIVRVPSYMVKRDSSQEFPKEPKRVNLRKYYYQRLEDSLFGEYNFLKLSC